MSITNNTIVAKTAAVVAGLGLVAMSFASFAPAQAQSTTDLQAQINSLLATIASLQAQLGGSSTASVTFTRDLTIGSTGSDVTALQTWLISKGYSIPAGATGYFGAQTQAALAAYQAANGITPAAGYFGPITRAKVGATAGTGTGTGTGTSTGGLSGGEADLNTFDLASGDGSGDEGESDVELATAKFDVDDGDVSVQRLELTASSTNDANIENKPWKFFDTINVMADGKKIGSVDASDRDNWDEGADDVYTIEVSGMNYVVREGDKAEITLEADINDSIDDADQEQEFDLSIGNNGIRAVDAAGIQQYIGDEDDTVSFGFDSEDNGDLTIRESSDNPDASVLKVDDDDTSDEYTVFAFEARNSNDADALITDLTIGTDLSSSTEHTSDVIRRATLEVDGDSFDGDIADANDGDIDFDDIDVQVDGNDTVQFVLKVEFASQSNHYDSGDSVSFSVDSADVDAEGADSGDELTGSDLSGSADSEEFTLSTTGFNVSATNDGDDNDADAHDATDNQEAYGTFKIAFSVTADEDDPVYIDKTAMNATTTGNGAAGVVYRVIKDNSTSGIATLDIDSATLDAGDNVDEEDTDTYRIDAGDTGEFTLTVTVDPTAAGNYAVELYQVNYADSAADADNASNNSTFNVDTNNSDFQTGTIFVAGG